MHRYQNVRRNSGVTHFEIFPTSIRIRFVNGAIYVYDYCMPGRRDVEVMKKLAVEGRGLSTYISQHVGERYASKEAD